MNLLKDKNSIIAWLDKYKVTNYTLIADKNYGFVVDVDGSVDLENSSLSSISVKFNIVSKDFNCICNKLTSLKGCPESVKGNFYCGYNKLKSLQYSPTSIGGDFYCGPNHLTSLESCPASVGGAFYCGYNNLTSLEGCPESVGGEFFCDNNPLLGQYQDIVDFSELKAKIRSDEEKKLLSQSLENSKKSTLHKV